MNMQKIYSIAILLVGFALLASAISTNKVVLFHIPPVLFVGIRMFVAGLLLVLYNIKNNHRMRFAYLWHDVVILLAISICTTFVPAILKALALKYMVSSKAAFFGSLDPFITVIYSYLFWHEKMTLQKILGILIGFSGTTLLLASTSPVEQSFMMFGFISYPEICAILAVAIGRLGWMLVQRLLKQERYSSTEINGVVMVISGFTALMSAPLIENLGFSLLHKPWWVYVLVVYTIVVGNIIAYTMYANALKRYTATFVSLAGFSVPIFVSFYGWLFLSERLSLNFFLSTLITFIGLLVFYQTELSGHIKKTIE